VIDDTSFDAALRRASFRLTYGKTDQSRQFREDGIDGPDVPNARGGGWQAGEWTQQPAWVVNGKPLEEATVHHWLAHFLSMAVNEAVHEALEHFQVDGQPYLDPHGKHEDYIYILVNELAENLADLAEADKHAWGCTLGPRHVEPCDGEVRPERL
jgi:hypothetical protein